MNTNPLLRNIKIFLCVLSLSVFLFPLSLTGFQRAHAQGLPVTDVLSTIQSTLTALSSAALEEKELVWDGLFYEIANQAMQQMTSDIIEWVNSGFDGEPAFVTDLIGYLQEIAQDVAADFIYGDEFSEACPAIQLNARLAIAQNVQQENEKFGGFKKKAACTIDDIPGGNPGAFINGTFSAGGWSMWFETVLNPQNTPIGLTVMGDEARRQAEAEAKFAANEDVRNGDGFKSQKVCTEDGCTITTPGKLIADQVSLALQAPLLRMIGADEMNEIIGALFSNLGQQALSGVNGLLGLGGNVSFSANVYGSSGDQSYLDAVRQEQTNTGSGASGSKIEQALRTETQVLELQLAIIQELDAISNTFLDTREPYESDSCWNLDLPEEFSDKLDELTEDVPNTVEAVVTLEAMLEAYEENTSSQGQLQILQQLSRMQTEGQLSGKTAVIQYENYLRNQLRSDIDEFEEEIEDEEDSC